MWGWPLFCLLALYQIANLAVDDYFSILGVQRNATKEEIKKAYRAGALKYHPDRSGNKSGKEFEKLSEAYEVLSDDVLRPIYTESGMEGVKRHREGSGGADHFYDDSDSFFSQFFGFGGGQKRHQQVPPYVVSLFVTLQQVYFGDMLEIVFNRPVLCPNTDECLVTKKGCVSPGIRVVTQAMGPGFYTQNQIRDESCIAKDKGWKPSCTACPEGPTEMKQTKTTVFLAEGADDMSFIEFLGGGAQNLNDSPGDVRFRVETIPSDRYRREGGNLHTNIGLTLLEALLGFSKTFPHIDRKLLTLNRVGITMEGEIEIIQGRGLPMKGGYQHGDLIIHYWVQYPKTPLSETGASQLKAALSEVQEWGTVDSI